MQRSRNHYLSEFYECTPVRLDEDHRGNRVANRDPGQEAGAEPGDRLELFEAENGQDAADDRNDDEDERAQGLKVT